MTVIKIINILSLIVVRIFTRCILMYIFNSYDKKLTRLKKYLNHYNSTRHSVLYFSVHLNLKKWYMVYVCCGK